MSTTMTIRLEDDTKDRLDKLAEATQRSRSFLAAEAIREYVELNEWQVSEIRTAIGEADRGAFAADDEVKRFFADWRRRAG
ncbi:CopG family ribbon-helix-helix protein [Sinimarinibacterium flocculans]|uniref:Putative transcriptional regulator n=1 Tax=Sinimarinibacterium flocculans TaxID=985250 RepID=A0A318E7P6_9GAMM|nr:putative transcriptional regulator [Sinimarinibacterium flocculans]